MHRISKNFTFKKFQIHEYSMSDTFPFLELDFEKVRKQSED